ncbi:hypothetical protein [Fibrella arboris]|uniref:hypothetical protein n=1 Tax=Fibrella arboris TaxID=3242486 RepID=UPI0035228EFE
MDLSVFEAAAETPACPAGGQSYLLCLLKFFDAVYLEGYPPGRRIGYGAFNDEYGLICCVSGK